MILVDRHIHSTFSDGENTPEEIVQEAIKRKMTEIGFSDQRVYHSATTNIYWQGL